jgi:Uri superfamily endonuclease
VLVMRLARCTTISIGRLGEFRFPTGWYLYVGSARGPGGLAARVSRHHRTSKTHHWHIDYLRAHAELIAAWYTTGRQKRECNWADTLSALPGAAIPVPRFGASDCRCPAHLIQYPTQPDPLAFVHLVEEPVFQRRLDR